MTTLRKTCLILGFVLLLLYVLWTYVMHGGSFDFRDALRVIFGNADDSFETIFAALGHLGYLALAIGLIIYPSGDGDEESSEEDSDDNSHKSTGSHLGDDSDDDSDIDFDIDLDD